MTFVKGHKKIGGAVKGKSSRADKLLAKIEKEDGKDPVEHMLDLMNDESQSIGLRLEAAKAAAPFTNRKQPTAIENTEMNPLQQLSEDELLQRLKEYDNKKA